MTALQKVPKRQCDAFQRPESTIHYSAVQWRGCPFTGRNHAGRSPNTCRFHDVYGNNTFGLYDNALR
jgi:hypothetical protein